MPGPQVQELLTGRHWPLVQAKPLGQVEPAPLEAQGMRQNLPSPPTSVQLPPRQTASLVQGEQAKPPSGKQVGVTSPPGLKQA